MKHYALAANLGVFRAALKRSKWDAMELPSGTFVAAIEYGDYSDRDALAAAGAVLLPPLSDPSTPIGAAAASALPAAANVLATDTSFAAGVKIFAALGWPPVDPARPLR